MRIKKYKQPLYESFDFDEKKDDSIDKEFEERLKQISFNKKFEESIKIGLNKIVEEYADKDGLIVTEIKLKKNGSIPEKYSDILRAMFIPLYKSFNVLGKNGWTLPKLYKNNFDGTIIALFKINGKNHSVEQDGNPCIDVFIKEIIISILYKLGKSLDSKEFNKILEQAFVEVTDKFKFFNGNLIETFTID